MIEALASESESESGGFFSEFVCTFLNVLSICFDADVVIWSDPL